MALILGLAVLGAGKKKDDDADLNLSKSENMDELKIEDVKIGSGELAEQGKAVTVHYTGTLLDGTKFDSSVDRGEPFKFTLGAGEVIQGWDMGFEGMRVGGVRRLVIPAFLGYGSRAVGPIPANSVLVFEVELLAVE